MSFIRAFIRPANLNASGNWPRSHRMPESWRLGRFFDYGKRNNVMTPPMLTSMPCRPWRSIAILAHRRSVSPNWRINNHRSRHTGPHPAIPHQPPTRRTNTRRHVKLVCDGHLDDGRCEAILADYATSHRIDAHHSTSPFGPRRTVCYTDPHARLVSCRGEGCAGSFDGLASGFGFSTWDRSRRCV